MNKKYTKKLVIKICILIFMPTQILMSVLFWSKNIREPYPALLLPAFDKVLTNESGQPSFITAEFYVEQGGEVTQFHPAEIKIPGISKAKLWWVLARMVPPKIDEQVSLPSYNYPFDEEKQSEKFLAALGDAVKKKYKDAKSFEVRWVKKSYTTNTSKKSIDLNDTIKIRSVYVEFDDR